MLRNTIKRACLVPAEPVRTQHHSSTTECYTVRGESSKESQESPALPLETGKSTSRQKRQRTAKTEKHRGEQGPCGQCVWDSYDVVSGSAESKKARLATQTKSKGSQTPTDSVVGLDDIYKDTNGNRVCFWGSEGGSPQLANTLVTQASREGSGDIGSDFWDVDRLQVNSESFNTSVK